MPRGDAQRVWFPLMLKELEQFWTPDVSWEAMIAFCRRMTSFRAQIRKAKGIQSPMMYCDSCKEIHRTEIEDVSPRSALFALHKRRVVSDAELESLDRDWAKYRKQNQLDAYGNPKAHSGS